MIADFQFNMFKTTLIYSRSRVWGKGDRGPFYVREAASGKSLSQL